VFCAEPLLVRLRPGHRLAGRDTVALQDLAHDVLGTTSADLFPAWALCQRQALDTAGISPPAIDLADTELAATRWADQPDIAWILLIPSLSAAHTTAVARFVHAALTAALPPGWHTQPDHLHHRE
jgi:hypothetical protein